jgi:hypothetical protein
MYRFVSSTLIGTLAACAALAYGSQVSRAQTSTTYCCTVDTTTGACTSTISQCTDTVFSDLETPGDLLQLEVVTNSSTFSFGLQQFQARGFQGQGFCVGSNNLLDACYAPSWGSVPPNESSISSMRWTFGTAFAGTSAQWRWCYGSPRQDGSCQYGSVNPQNWCCDPALSIQPNAQGTYTVETDPNLSCTLVSGGDTCTMSVGGACGTFVSTTDRCGLSTVASCSCVTGSHCSQTGTCAPGPVPALGAAAGPMGTTGLAALFAAIGVFIKRKRK